MKRSTLSKLPRKFLDCHLYKHAWEYVRDDDITYNHKNIVVQCVQVDRCLRCQMIRWFAVAIPSGHRIGSYNYDAPEGYYMEKVEGQRVSLDEVRAEHARRRNKKLRETAA